MSSLFTWVRNLIPAALFSGPVIAGVTLELLFVQLASPYDSRQRILVIIAAGLVGAVVPFVTLVLIYVSLRPFLTQQSLSIVLLVSIPVAALLGGLSLGWARAATGLEPESFVPLRVAATFMHVTTVTLLLWLAVSAVRAHYQRLDALRKEQDQLEHVERETDYELAQLDDVATEAVRTRILKGLTLPNTAAGYQVVSALTATIDEIIRPLSRQLEAQTGEWVPPHPRPLPNLRINWKAAAADGMSPALVNPVGLLIILSLFALPMNLFRNGPVFALTFLLLTAVGILPIVWVIQRTAIRLTRRARSAKRITTFIIMSLLWGLSFGLVTLPIAIGTPQPLRYFILGPTFTLIIAFLWGSAAAAQQQARASEQALMQATADLQWRITRARELHRQRRRALAHAIHGEVQAALAAGILELDSAIQAGTLSDDQINQVQRRLIDCVQGLDLHKVEPLDIWVVIQKVQATWAGVVTISIELDPNIASSLRTDPQTLMTLNDVIPELVFNSVRHGKAHHVQLTIALKHNRTLHLTATDDGCELAHEREAGLGSRLLDSCAIDWQRERLGHNTVTSILMPFAPIETANSFVTTG
jgi:signal transduction histidine kinase